MNRIFRVFCINRLGLGPLHYFSSRSDFGFEFAEIFVIEKRLPDSPSQGVDKNAYRYNFFQVFNPNENDQGRKGPCFFQRLIALKCLKCQKIQKNI